MKLTINLCTRNRPALLLNTLNKTLPNIRDKNTRLIVSVDDDDADTAAVLLPYEDDIITSVLPREDSLGEKFNRALIVAPADLYFYMVDYAPVLTPGFDEVLLQAANPKRFPDGIGLVTTRMANASFSASQAITAGLAERMGFIFPPYFPYWFVDHWADEMARMIDRFSFADIHIDHWTYRPDRTTGMREPDFWASFFDAMHIVRRRCATEIVLSDEFREPAHRKALLLSNFTLHEQRSQWINNFVRANVQSIEYGRGENGPPDDRYIRIKKRAIRVLREVVKEMEAQEQLAA